MSSRVAKIVLALMMMILVIPPLAQAKCYLGGEITAARTTDPNLPNWEYTAVIDWDTVTQYALSHLDLLLDTANGNCSCAELAADLYWVGVAGKAVGEEGCEVEFEASMECRGDPSIPDLDGILLKFEPIGMECEPGPIGTATLTFYSDQPPAPIDEEILLLFDKFSGLACSGYLSGVFPGLACDPVSSESMNWDALKSTFH